MLLYTYIAVLFITFLFSLRSLRLNRIHYRIISLILAIDLVSEIISLMLVRHEMSNVGLYSFTGLAEFWLYALYFTFITTYAWLRKVIRIYLILLPVAWLCLTLFVFTMSRWNSHFFAAGCVAMVALSIVYYHQIFTQPDLVKLHKTFEFWIATALVTYYAWVTPYLGMLNFLTKAVPVLANRLVAGLQILNIIFYLIVLYAYICTTNLKKLA